MFTVTYSIPWNIMMTMLNKPVGYCCRCRFAFWSDLPFANKTVVLVVRIVLRVPPGKTNIIFPWENQYYIYHLGKPILYFPPGKTDIIFLEIVCCCSLLVRVCTCKSCQAAFVVFECFFKLVFFVCLLLTWIHHQSSCEGRGFQPVRRHSWSLWTPLGHLWMSDYQQVGMGHLVI